MLASGSPFKSPNDSDMTFPLEIETTVVKVDSLSLEVPSLLVDSFTFLAKEGLTEGIFRVSGSVRRIRDVAQDFNGYKSWLYSDEKSPNSHDVCGVIKLFLREYDLSMNGIFSSSISQSLKKLYLQLLRKDSSASSNSCLSASSVLSTFSSLPDIDETKGLESTRTLNLHQFLSSSAQLLISKNSEKKNELALYLLHMLHELQKLLDVTKMTSENLSIIFHPYIFTPGALSDLSVFQDILAVLIVNQKSLVQEYSKYVTVLEGFDETEADAVSITSLDSHYKSCSTDFSSIQASPTSKAVTGVPEVSRRFSLSQKISSIWDGYNSPANKSKRFSFISRGSDKSNDDLIGGTHAMCPQESVKSIESIDEMFSSTMSFPKVPVLNASNCETPHSLSLEVEKSHKMDMSQELPKKPSRRMSLLKTFRSIKLPMPESVKVDRFNNCGLPTTGNLKGKSVDDLLLSSKTSGMVPEKKNLMKRRLSLWIKKD